VSPTSSGSEHTVVSLKPTTATIWFPLLETCNSIEAVQICAIASFAGNLS
jgi:hypothetical protein